MNSCRGTLFAQFKTAAVKCVYMKSLLLILILLMTACTAAQGPPNVALRHGACHGASPDAPSAGPPAGNVSFAAPPGGNNHVSSSAPPAGNDTSRPFILILGITQDAGYPQMGCAKACCSRAWRQPALKRMVTSLAVADPASRQWWLLEATPDIKEQLHLFQKLTGGQYDFLPNGILITHAHTGHYTGLMQLGREAMNTKRMPVFVLPGMKRFLETNGPWSQLVQIQNIELQPFMAGSVTALNSRITVTPFTVPHRDEYSETAGFSIGLNGRSALFIPDIDKWNKFERPLDSLVKAHRLSFLDGTFYKDGELPNRPMSEVPHPFVEETKQALAPITAAEKKTVYFIHFNHTNPLLNRQSAAYKQTAAQFGVAEQGRRYMP
jgi:pyrroloquinoline quinone biosynthesis protein B